MHLLEALNISKNFGGLTALSNVSFHLDAGEIVGLIGPNGAGKTTLFNIVAGVYRPDTGQILFKGEGITGLKPHDVCLKGIARTFQLVKPFAGMTVIQNVLSARLFGKDRVRDLSRAKREAAELLELTGLEQKSSAIAATLTTAERKRLELTRALATAPELLLLDEVLSGLNAVETDEATSIIKRIRQERRISIFMVEHVMRALMDLSDRIIVLREGQKLADGTPEDVVKLQSVIDTYMGEESLNE